jgi:hypothetical protein
MERSTTQFDYKSCLQLRLEVQNDDVTDVCCSITRAITHLPNMSWTHGESVAYLFILPNSYGFVKISASCFCAVITVPVVRMLPNSSYRTGACMGDREERKRVG